MVTNASVITTKSTDITTNPAINPVFSFMTICISDEAANETVDVCQYITYHGIYKIPFRYGYEVKSLIQKIFSNNDLQ